jgi:hypothetical protein
LTLEVGGTVDPIARHQYSTDFLTLSEPLFHLDINSPQGWFAHECLVPNAELSLFDEQGKDHIIYKGYLRFDNSAFRTPNWTRLWPQCRAAARLERL